MPEPGQRTSSYADLAECFVQRDLPGCRRQQVLTAQHMGDSHYGVIDRIDQRIEGLTV